MEPATQIPRVDVAECHRRGAVDAAADAGLPPHLAVRGADRGHLPAVVADEDGSVVICRRGLDRTPD